MQSQLVKVDWSHSIWCLERIKFLFEHNMLFKSAISELELAHYQKALRFFYLPNGYGGEDGLLAVSACQHYSSDQPDLKINFMYCQRPHFFQNLVSELKAVAKAGGFKRLICEVPTASRARLYQRVGFESLSNNVLALEVM